MLRFTRKLFLTPLSPRLPIAAWWAWRTLGFERPGRVRGRVHFDRGSARLDWRETGELLHAMSIFEPANPWNGWVPTGEINTVVDVGANIGQTVAYWAMRFPKARLGAVEMMPENVARLEEHARLNGWRLQVVAVAAADHPGEVVVQRNTASARHRLDEFVQVSSVREGLTNEKAVVPALPIGTILDQLAFPEVDLMKVDIEGAEVLLLHDIANWAPRVRNLMLELHDNIDESWARKTLRAAGFNIQRLEGQNRTEWFCTRAHST